MGRRGQAIQQLREFLAHPDLDMVMFAIEKSLLEGRPVKLSEMDSGESAP
jgi:hypothetical protein